MRTCKPVSARRGSQGENLREPGVTVGLDVRRPQRVIGAVVLFHGAGAGGVVISVAVSAET